MSVINQMLKDLEDRRGDNKPKAVNALLGVKASGGNAQRRRWFALSLGLVFVMAAVGVAIIITSPQPKTTATVVQHKAKTIEPIDHKSHQVHLATAAAKAILPPVEIPKQQQSKSSLAKSFVPLSPLQAAQNNYQDAMNQANQGQFLAATKTLQAILQKTPSYKPARESLAAFLIQQGHYSQAFAVLAKGLELAPSDADFTKMQAHLLYQQGHPQQALMTLLQASPSMRKDPGYYAFMAALYEKLNQPQLAAQLYRDLAALNPQNGLYWLGLGVAFEQMNQLNEAITAYEKASNSGNLKPQLQAYVLNRIQSLKE